MDDAIKNNQREFKSRLAWLVLINYRDLIRAAIWNKYEGLSKSVCHRHWLPADVTSEVILRLHPHIFKHNGRYRLPTIIYNGVRWILLKMHQELRVVQERDVIVRDTCSLKNEVEPIAVDAASNAELVDVVADCLRFLTTRERVIIEQRTRQHGTLAKVGKTLGITKGRVRQIESRAISRMRCSSYDRLLPFVNERFTKEDET